MTEIYISLGYNCDPRICIKYNMGLNKDNGYKTCPFDLCITSFESLCKCIETDFQYFFDDLRLIPGGCADGRNINDLKGKHNITNHYNIIFNHEGSTHSHLFKDNKNDDLFYIRNDFEKFKERYALRINNYKEYISNYNKIIFIYKKDKTDDKYNPEILFKLLNKYNKPIRIITIMD